jgi:hypothetical protein
MERNKYKELMVVLNNLEPSDLVSLYVEAKTGLENPMNELPLYLQLSLSDIKDWIDNYNNNKALELAKVKEQNGEVIREMFEKEFDIFIAEWEKKKANFQTK